MFRSCLEGAVGGQLLGHRDQLCTFLLSREWAVGGSKRFIPLVSAEPGQAQVSQTLLPCVPRRLADSHLPPFLSLLLSLSLYGLPSLLLSTVSSSLLSTSFFRLTIVHHAYSKTVVLALEVIGSYSSSAHK